MVVATTMALSSLLLVAPEAAPAAEVKVLAGAALYPALSDLIPKFEQSSGHKVTIEYGSVGRMTERIRNGEAADVAIVSAAQIDDLLKTSKLVAGSRVDLARAGIGAFVRKGAPKPDLTSVEEFKRALLAAKSVGIADPANGSPVAIYLMGLLERLGIADEIRAKSGWWAAPMLDHFPSVVRGDVEIAFGPIPEILAVPAVDFAGPLPPAIQNYTSFAAGIAAISQQTDAAKTFVDFISSPAALASMKAKGFEAFASP